MKKLLLGIAALLTPLALPSSAHAVGTFGLIPHGTFFPCCNGPCGRQYNAFTPPCCTIPVFVPGGQPHHEPPCEKPSKWHFLGHQPGGRMSQRFPGHYVAPGSGYEGCASGFEGYVTDGSTMIVPPTSNALLPPKNDAPATTAQPSGPNLPLGRPITPGPTAPPNRPTTQQPPLLVPTSYYQPAYPAYPYYYPYSYPYAPMYGAAPYYGR